MKKQEAIDYILQELDRGRSKAEIAADLSESLNAPLDLMKSFVSQVAKEQAPTKAKKAGSQAGGSIPVTEEPSASSFLLSREEPAALGGESWRPEPFSSAETDPGDDPALARLILKEVGKGRKTSDVIMRVCEETGMSWDKAQRLVGRVTLENRKQLASRRNRLFIPVGILFVLAGLGLVIATGMELYPLLSGIKGGSETAEMLLLSGNSIRRLVAELLLGLGLLIGGTVGLVQALKEQWE